MTDIIARALALNAKGLAKAIADLAAQGLTYKGAVEKTTDLPASPTIGDTYYVAEEGGSYVWTEYKGTNQWLPLSKEGKRGPAGEDGNGIVSITKTSTVGLVDTYTITFTDGTTSTFTVANGESGGGSSVKRKTFGTYVATIVGSNVRIIVTDSDVTTNTLVNLYPRNVDTETFLQDNMATSIISESDGSFNFTVKTDLPDTFAAYYTITEVI